jgi:hypothetical protein
VRETRAAAYRRFLLEFGLFCSASGLSACGKTPSTAPAVCEAIPANFVRTDTLYGPSAFLHDGTPAPRVVLFLVDIFACDGADVAGKPRTP